MREKQRTTTQNKALHVYCGLVADALNDAGFDMRRFIKPEIDIPWSMVSVKEHLWKVIISDNTVDQYESNLMRRICGLIYFPDKESAEIKLKLINSK